MRRSLMQVPQTFCPHLVLQELSRASCYKKGADHAARTFMMG
jgi:hypothetical protein